MIRVGVAGWSYADWKGRAYPRSGVHPLAYLARSFDCVEVNSSFYAIPAPANVHRWVQLVEELDDFRFTLKLNRDFTHGHDGRGGGADFPDRGTTSAMLASLEPVASAGKLGAFLAQFHQAFSDTPRHRERLLAITKAFGHLPLVVELRHRSWFRTDTLAWLVDLPMSLAHVDMPPSSSPHLTVVPPITSAERLPYRVGPLAYLRLHGRNAAAWYDPKAGRDATYDWLYTEDEVRTFGDYARKLAANDGETYVVTNNHFGGKAVANGLDLLAGLRGEPPAASPEIVAAFPHLAGKVRVFGQGSLF